MSVPKQSTCRTTRVNRNASSAASRPPRARGSTTVSMKGQPSTSPQNERKAALPLTTMCSGPRRTTMRAVVSDTTDPSFPDPTCATRGSKPRRLRNDRRSLNPDVPILALSQVAGMWTMELFVDPPRKPLLRLLQGGRRD